MNADMLRGMTDDSEEEAKRDPLIRHLREEFDRLMARDTELKATIETACPGALSAITENNAAMCRWMTIWNSAVMNYWAARQPAPQRRRGRPSR